MSESFVIVKFVKLVKFVKFLKKSYKTLLNRTKISNTLPCSGNKLHFGKFPGKFLKTLQQICQLEKIVKYFPLGCLEKFPCYPIFNYAIFTIVHKKGFFSSNRPHGSNVKHCGFINILFVLFRLMFVIH